MQSTFTNNIIRQARAMVYSAFGFSRNRQEVAGTVKWLTANKAFLYGACNTTVKIQLHSSHLLVSMVSFTNIWIQTKTFCLRSPFDNDAMLHLFQQLWLKNNDNADREIKIHFLRTKKATWPAIFLVGAAVRHSYLTCLAYTYFTFFLTRLSMLSVNILEDHVFNSHLRGLVFLAGEYFKPQYGRDTDTMQTLHH